MSGSATLELGGRAMPVKIPRPAVCDVSERK